MAAPSPRKKLQEETTCSVCLDFFTEPVILDCGHNFCRACIAQCLAEAPTHAACPQCRERVQPQSLKANRQLASFVEIAKELQASQGGGGWAACERHQEPLKLFCKEDEAPICVVCDRSKEHRGHNVVPVEEAAQEYKEKLNSSLEMLRKKREEILAHKAADEKESQNLLEQTKAERQKMVAEFRQLHQFLEEQEKLLLVQMEEAEKEVAARRDERLAKLSGELSSLQAMIQKVEEKCQQPASELLQDVKSTLERCKKEETSKNPMAFPVALKWRIWEFSDINPFLEGIRKQFKDTLVSGLRLQKANISLNPDTAHPQLVLSKDFTSVKWGVGAQDVADSHGRFDQRTFLLGCEGFTAGRHYWEVNVGSEGEWAVGVARKSVRRKGWLDISPEDGIWAVKKCGGKLWVSVLPPYECLSSGVEPKIIRISLNYAGGQVAFFDADTAAKLFAFSGASFSKETLFPFFNVFEKAHLQLSPLRSQRVKLDPDRCRTN